MKKATVVIFFIASLFVLNKVAAQYNTLWIPDTLSGKTFNLNIKDTFSQIVSTGNQTITGGINAKFWGPTIFINKGDTVRMNVRNYLMIQQQSIGMACIYLLLWMVVRIKLFLLAHYGNLIGK